MSTMLKLESCYLLKFFIYVFLESMLYTYLDDFEHLSHLLLILLGYLTHMCSFGLYLDMASHFVLIEPQGTYSNLYLDSWQYFIPFVLMVLLTLNSSLQVLLLPALGVAYMPSLLIKFRSIGQLRYIKCSTVLDENCL